MPESRPVCIERNDASVDVLVTSYGKRQLAAWLHDAEEKVKRYEEALREIARWDDYRTFSYKGPKRVAAAALGQEKP